MVRWITLDDLQVAYDKGERSAFDKLEADFWAQHKIPDGERRSPEEHAKAFNEMLLSALRFRDQ